MRWNCIPFTHPAKRGAARKADGTEYGALAHQAMEEMVHQENSHQIKDTADLEAAETAAQLQFLIYILKKVQRFQ